MSMFEGQMVRLRAFDNGDLVPLWKSMNDADVMGLLSGAPVLPATMEDAAQFMAAQTSHSTGEYQFAIERLEDGRFLGRCGLSELDRRNLRAEVTIHIGEEEMRGRGYGTDALSILCRFAFEDLNLHRLKAHVYACNEHSIRCLEKSGFQQEGVLKEEMYRFGRWHDVVAYALMRCEWEALNERTGED